jgi:DNA mismatch endonuclease, patch repair protein
MGASTTRSTMIGGTARDRGTDTPRLSLRSRSMAAMRESWASSPGVRASMRSNKSRDTGPELALRSAVHRLGLRYRVGVRPVSGLRRTGDLVFSRARVVVFLDGCFWHGCPEHHTVAKKNAEFWAGKVRGNRERDVQTTRRMEEAGWCVIRVWEHESPTEAALRIADTVRKRLESPHGQPTKRSTTDPR